MIKINLFENKNSIEIRKIMTSYGWSSNDKFTQIGWGDKFGYSIWFERHDWHGKNTYSLTGNKVCFHRHINDLSEIDNITRECAIQALKAYEDYVDCIPCQNIFNKTIKSQMFYDWNDERSNINKNDD